MAEGLLGDVEENGLSRTAEKVFCRGPAMDLPASGVSISPLRGPLADAFLTL